MRRPLAWKVIACVFAAAFMPLLVSAPALAQYETLVAIMPTELSVGLGGVLDRNPVQSSVGINLGLARPPSLGFEARRDQWIEPALEIGLGPTSDEALCQRTDPLAPPDTCVDAYLLIGPRFRPIRASDRPYRPFVQLLIGGYWKGTGLKEPDLNPVNTALQVGGGIDIRRPESIHGLRLSGDYRHVFADGGRSERDQLQLLASYFVGWRGNP
jgi:hypothetical protein